MRLWAILFLSVDSVIVELLPTTLILFNLTPFLRPLSFGPYLHDVLFRHHDFPVRRSPLSPRHLRQLTLAWLRPYNRSDRCWQCELPTEFK